MNLTGTIPTEIGKLIKLTNLYVNTFLRLLFFSAVGLSGRHLPPPFCVACFRVVYENNLGGTIPTELGKLPVLQVL